MPDAPSPRTEGIPILPPDRTIYFNGFAVALGPGDVVITLSRNGIPLLTLNASYTVSKSFGQAVTTTIERLEKEASHEILTVQAVAEAIDSVKSPSTK
jgi:citrate lyase gamma subunit